mgnify:CR=1 FL=1
MIVDRWPNQIRAFDGAMDAIQRGVKRLCITSPTGSGKTRSMIDMLEWCNANGKTAILYCQRRMLYDQTSRVLEEHKIAFGKRASGHQPALLRNIQLAMFQTEVSRSKDSDYELHPADVVLVDEVHQAGGDTYQELLKSHAQAGAVIIGYTATPLDLVGYDELLVAGWPSECRAFGALVAAQTYAPDEPDLRHIRRYQVGEDLTEKDNSKAIMRPGVFGRVLQAWRDHNPEERPTILFGPDVAGSLFFAQQFQNAGIRAAHIDGDECWLDGEFHPTEHEIRSQIAKMAATGEVKVVCNRFVCREGIDWPWLECGIFATVFGSLTSFLQSGGRLLRASEGKESAIVIDHGGCLDEQTEILTRRGWLDIDTMRENDEIATMNLDTGDCEWSFNLGTLRKPCDAPMLAFRSNYADIRVTDYHNMIVKGDVRRGRWRIVSATTLAERASNGIIPTATIERIEPAQITDDEVRFLGWFLTDGSMEPSRPSTQYGYRNRVRIFQSANSPKKHHQHIRDCLDGCGFQYTVQSRIRKSPFRPSETSEELIYSISSGRKSSHGWKHLDAWLYKDLPVIYESLDARQFGILLEAMNLGDGSKNASRNKSYAIAISDDATASRLQALAVRRGFRCNRRFQSPINPRHKGVYILNLRPSNVLTIARGSFSASPVMENERVWCVQTKNGTIIIRRNGKVAVVGNSWHRHGSLNADREWALGLTNHRVVGERAEKLRERKEPEPIVCPNCGKVRAGGKKCFACGYEAHKHSRCVVQIDGTLRQVDGPAYKPRRVKCTPQTPALWERMYYRARSKRWSATFRQAEAMFFRENHFWPPRNLPLMPRDAADFYRKVSDVSQDSLYQKEPQHAE